MGSLNNELKDFINAFAAGQKMLPSKDDQEYKRLKNQVLKAQLQKATDPELMALDKKIKQRQANAPYFRPTDSELTRSRRITNDTNEFLLNEARKKRDGAVEAPAGPTIPQFGTTPNSASSGRTSALELPNQNVAALEDDEEEDDPTLFASRGGAVPYRYSHGGPVSARMEKPMRVRRYALGGPVEEVPDDEPDDDTDDQEVEQQPVVTPQVTNGGDTQDTLVADGYSRQAAHDAVLAGLQYARNGSGSQGAIGTPRGASSLVSYLRGDGAAKHDEMQGVLEKIDPKGEMTESERNMAALATVYEWKLKQNDPQGAAKAASSMVQYYRQVSGRYQALAAAAAENGDVDGTLYAIMKAHANVPDGKDLHIQKNQDGTIKYSFTDTQSGKTVEHGIATPDELLKWATRGGMQNFDDLIVRAGGERHQLASGKGKAASVKGPSKDTMKSLDALTSAGPDGAKPAVSLDPELADSTKHLAGQIMDENGMSGSDAMRAVSALVHVGGPAPVKFKVQKQKDGGAVVDMDGREIQLSKHAFDNLVVLRGRSADVFRKKTTEARDTAQAGADRAMADVKRDNIQAEAQKKSGAEFEDLFKGETERAQRRMRGNKVRGSAIPVEDEEP